MHDAGLSVLAEHGVDAVRLEPLSRLLAVTKGSFYWRFKDRADLLAAMLVSWRRQATLKIIERIERTQRAPLEKLRQLIDLPVLKIRPAAPVLSSRSGFGPSPTPAQPKHQAPAIR